MPDPDATPDTVTEAVTLLRELGYTDELRLDAEGVRCGAREGCHPAAGAEVDHVFRFEGPSDPADEAIVLGVHLPEWSIKGIVVSAFGPYLDEGEAGVLAALTESERRPRS